MRFTRVHLENWKNFTRVEAPLQSRVFLIGPNASGKSNLLDAFRFLNDLVRVGGGFQEAVRIRGGVSRLRSLAARRYPDIVIRVDVGSDVSPSEWTYQLSFTQDNQRRPIVRRERVFHDGELLVDRPEQPDLDDKERLTQTYIEQINVNKPFRDLADFLSSIRYLHVVPQLVREPDRSVGRTRDPFGGDFLEQIVKTPERTRAARLRRIEGALRTAVPQLKELSEFRDDRGTPHLRGRYEHWRPRGAWQTEEQFSDGTLRLMGLLWAILDGTGPLLLEEPELSLHPGVVRFIPQMLHSVQRRSPRQVMISTHSIELLADEGIGLDEVLLLDPQPEGTVIRVATEFEEIGALVNGGVTLGEAVLPQTRPKNAEQLALFGL
jgi:hypothetical protein